MEERKMNGIKEFNDLATVNGDGHITVRDVHPGQPPMVFNIYIKRNAGDFRLWCELDKSYECYHVKAAWTYPEIQKMVMQYRGRSCLSCSYENPAIALYCMKCGTRLE